MRAYLVLRKFIREQGGAPHFLYNDLAHWVSNEYGAPRGRLIDRMLRLRCVRVHEHGVYSAYPCRIYWRRCALWALSGLVGLALLYWAYGGAL